MPCGFPGHTCSFPPHQACAQLQQPAELYYCVTWHLDGLGLTTPTPQDNSLLPNLHLTPLQDLYPDLASV